MRCARRFTILYITSRKFDVRAPKKFVLNTERGGTREILGNYLEQAKQMKSEMKNKFKGRFKKNLDKKTGQDTSQ